MPKLDHRLVAFLQFLGNAVGALLMAVLFLTILMTAAAQQRVTGRLEVSRNATGVGADAKATEDIRTIDYSTGWARMEAAERAEQELAIRQNELSSLLEKTGKAQDNFDSLKASAERAWAPLRPIALAAKVKCEISDKDLDLDINAAPAVWEQVRNCADTNAALATRIQSMAAQSATFAEAVAKLDKATDAKRTAASEQQRKQMDVEALKGVIASVDSIRPYFSDMMALQHQWYLGWGAFVEVPPSMIQILLAFFSGTFGALLVTLVLIVYPHNAISASAGSSNAARIFLGGLISTGVYIVLGGGASILGSSNAFDETKASFMTFCAVGVLAGMFSDRVALWLSARADVFFANQQQQAAAATPPAQVGGADQAAAAPHVYG